MSSKFRTALGASVPCEPVIEYLEPFAPDDRGLACRAVRVFAVSGQISHREKPQTGPAADVPEPFRESGGRKR